MASKIILKKSSEPGKVPQSLEYGELAINYADGVLYYKNSSNQITQISGSSEGTGSSLIDNNFLLNSGSIGIADNSPQQVVIDQFSANSWRSARYQLQVTSEYTYYTCDIVILHDGFDAFLVKTNEVVLENNVPGTFLAEFVPETPSLIRLNFIPQYGETTIVFSRTLLANTGSATGLLVGDLQAQSGNEDLAELPVVSFDLEAGGIFI